nr:MAG TPA: hypothetical protein [Caudoviricetes sp.]
MRDYLLDEDSTSLRLQTFSIDFQIFYLNFPNLSSIEKQSANFKKSSIPTEIVDI